ncbi:MAG: hypothetical protein M1330_01020 [Armatimonadetes bacterium]|nr:hypothetical protein [Armatimonadota bacterium]
MRWFVGGMAALFLVIGGWQLIGALFPREATPMRWIHAGLGLAATLISTACILWIIDIITPSIECAAAALIVLIPSLIGLYRLSEQNTVM